MTPETPHPEIEQEDVAESIPSAVTEDKPRRRKERDIFGRVPRHSEDWSHRKGEPRTFALLWMIYLMGASLLMVSSIAVVQSTSPGVVRPAARAMVVTAAIGIFVLWPIVRLSQILPKKSKLGAAFADLVVMTPPIVALLAPQTLRVLAVWPVEVVVATAAAIVAWAALIAVLIAIAQSTLNVRADRDQVRRVLWMLVFLAIAFAAPFLSLLAGYGAVSGRESSPILPSISGTAAYSPVSLVYDLVRDRSATGRSAAVSDYHWIVIFRVAAAASALWALALVTKLVRTRQSA